MTVSAARPSPSTGRRLDIALEGRVAAAVARAEALLGDRVPSDGSAADALRGLIDALTASVAADGEDAPSAVCEQ
ncbi:MAG TPA: hypothetical protein VMF14_13770, partial [Solirubrobacteraceae bacterium]|nr:hypothetical protein [Solirubrobacteraceae bacterium]